MKPTRHIALIIILLLQSGGMLIFYQVQRGVVQYEMQKVLNSRETQFKKINLSFKDYQKSKINDWEIILDGEMYDVKSVNISGDKVELLAVHDTGEEGIINKIIKEFSHNSRQNSNLPQYLVKLFTLVYTSPSANHDFSAEGGRQIIFQPQCQVVISNKTDISSPPPELA